jgi:hypothetical protein
MPKVSVGSCRNLLFIEENWWDYEEKCEYKSIVKIEKREKFHIAFRKISHFLLTILD